MAVGARDRFHNRISSPQTGTPPSAPPLLRARRGAFHISPSSVANAIERYVRRAEIRTAAGKLALDLHPHLFRHHLGTSMVNENIPLTVIQEVLDHGPIEMTPATRACTSRRSSKR